MLSLAEGNVHFKGPRKKGSGLSERRSPAALAQV
jgi:hypothetical protein